MNDDVSQRCRQQLGVFQLVSRTCAVEHRAAGVDKKMGDEVGFLLVLLDRVSLRAAVALPVDMADVVARNILTVLHELHGETAIGTAMIADAQPLDDHPGLDAQGFGPTAAETWCLPCRPACALAARMRFKLARGPAPQVSHLLTKSTASGVLGRVMRAMRLAYAKMWSATGTRRTMCCRRTISSPCNTLSIAGCRSVLPSRMICSSSASL